MGSAEAERDFAECASDAMLALVLAEQAAFGELCEELVARAPDEGGRARASAAMRELGSGVDGSLSRGAKRAFSAKLKAWVVELHACGAGSVL